MMNLTHIASLSYSAFDHIYSKVGYLFYIVNPKESMFEEVSKVPRYVEEV